MVTGFPSLTLCPHLDIVELPDLAEAAHVGLRVLVVPELDGLAPVVAPLHHCAGLQVVAPQLVNMRRIPVNVNQYNLILLA